MASRNPFVRWKKRKEEENPSRTTARTRWTFVSVFLSAPSLLPFLCVCPWLGINEIKNLTTRPTDNWSPALLALADGRHKHTPLSSIARYPRAHLYSIVAVSLLPYSRVAGTSPNPCRKILRKVNRFQIYRIVGDASVKRRKVHV